MNRQWSQCSVDVWGAALLQLLIATGNLSPEKYNNMKAGTAQTYRDIINAVTQ